MSDANPQDQLHPAERAYLNPGRPNLIDLVPEFAALPNKERLRVMKAASKRIGWRENLTGISLVSHIPLLLFIVLTIGMQVLSISALHLGIQFPPAVQSAKNLEQAYNVAAAQNPGYIVIHLDLAPIEKVARWLSWFRQNRLLMPLAMLAVVALWAYCWQVLDTRIKMYLLLPHVRAVLREEATGKGPGSE